MRRRLSRPHIHFWIRRKCAVMGSIPHWAHRLWNLLNHQKAVYQTWNRWSTGQCSYSRVLRNLVNFRCGNIWSRQRPSLYRLIQILDDLDLRNSFICVMEHYYFFHILLFPKIERQAEDKDHLWNHRCGLYEASDRRQLHNSQQR